MNEKNFETKPHPTQSAPKQTPSYVAPELTFEEFSQWLDESLDQLVLRHSGFATTNSNRDYFSR